MNSSLRILTLFLLTLIIAGCGQSGFLSQSPSSSAETTMDVKGFEAYVTEKGEPMYILQAEEARLKEKNNVVELDDIDLKFFQEDKDTSNTLTADSGSYYLRNSAEDRKNRNDIDLFGNIRLVKSDGTTLKTSRLHYDSKSEKIYSDAGFEQRKIAQNRVIVLKGKSFVTDRSMNQFEQVGGEISFEPLKSD